MISAVLYARELDRMVAFYCGLGLEVTEAQPSEFAVLQGASAELTLVQVPPAIAQQIEIADPPVPRATNPVKLAFDVASIEDSLSQAVSFGGQALVDSPRWEFNGKTIQDAVDPEGNVVQFRGSSQRD